MSFNRKFNWIILVLSGFFISIIWVAYSTIELRGGVENYLHVKIKSCNFFPRVFSNYANLYNCQIIDPDQSLEQRLQEVQIHLTGPMIFSQKIRRVSIKGVTLQLKGGKIFWNNRNIYNIVDPNYNCDGNFVFINTRLVGENHREILANCIVKVNDNKLRILVDNTIYVEINHGITTELKTLNPHSTELVYTILDSIVPKEKSHLLKEIIEKISNQNKTIIITPLEGNKVNLHLNTILSDIQLRFPIWLNDKEPVLKISKGQLSYSLFNQEDLYVKACLSPDSDLSLLLRGKMFCGFYRGQDPQNDIGFVIPDIDSSIEVKKIFNYEITLNSTNTADKKSVEVPLCKISCGGKIPLLWLGVLEFERGDLIFRKKEHVIQADGILNCHGEKIPVQIQPSNGQNKVEFSFPINFAVEGKFSFKGMANICYLFSNEQPVSMKVNLEYVNAFILGEQGKRIAAENSSVEISPNHITGTVMGYTLDLIIKDSKFIMGTIINNNCQYLLKAEENTIIITTNQGHWEFFQGLDYLMKFLYTIIPLEEFQLVAHIESYQLESGVTAKNVTLKYSVNKDGFILEKASAPMEETNADL